MTSGKLNKTIYYIGAFPPAYGGVTIKNKNLYYVLSNYLNVQKIDLTRIKRGEVKELLRFAWAMLTGKQYIIGVSSRKNRRIFTRILYWFKRKAMRRSILIVMGGVVDDVINAHTAFLKMFNTYKKTYVELPGMLEKLEAAGVRNVAVYPNGRPRPDALPDPVISEGVLRCVFFSTIQPEKGVDLILQTAQKLSHMQFHFYGEITKSYEQDFISAIELMENTAYHGVFTGNADAVYRELSEYDVLLLPTKWETEGIPGVVVEAKIAGLPAVVSHNVNKELIHHNYDGVVIQEITAEELIATLKDLDRNREKLLSMKIAAKASAEQYYIDICAQDVISCIQQGGEKWEE